MKGTKFYAYLVRDCHGNWDQGVFNEEADEISVCGLQNPQGYALHFDSEAKHLKQWADENGVEAIVEEGWHLFRATFSENEVGLEVTERHGDDLDDLLGQGRR